MFTRAISAAQMGNKTNFQPSSLQSKTLRPDGPLGGVAQGSGQLKEVRARIKSIKSVEKITKTMKMIASSRLKAAQNKMIANRPFTEGAALVNKEIPVDLTRRNLIIAMFADRGLCGGINSFVNKYVTALITERRSKSPSAEFDIVFLGNKGTLLSKLQSERLRLSARDVGKPIISFTGVGELVDRIVELPQTESATVVFNRFENAAQFTTVHVDLNGRPGMNIKEYDAFEFEEDQAIFHKQDLYEFQLGSIIYGAVVESAASELSARMTAMDNASRNAGDILKRLNIFYNRGRQAAITTELSEIIGGAAALDG